MTDIDLTTAVPNTDERLIKVENKLTKTARVTSKAVQGILLKNTDGNIVRIPATGQNNDADLTNWNFGGNSNTKPVNPDTPGYGDDIYAGSIEKGEITDRNMISNTVTDPNSPTTITPLFDVGNKFNMVGDGAMFYIHIIKTVMTKGVKGETSTLQINYDPTNKVKDGYFTTMAPYPAAIVAGSFVVGKKLTIPLVGVGDGTEGTNIKAPTVTIVFNDDKTLTITNTTGYINDGDSAGATGVNFDAVVDMISTYSTQDAVPQLPGGINVFNGNTSGQIALSAVNDYFTNISGLKISLDDRIYFTDTTDKGVPIYEAVSTQDFNIPTVFTIYKNDLINNYEIDLNKYIKFDDTQTIILTRRNNDGTYYSEGSMSLTNWKFNSPYIQINEKTITASISADLTMRGGVVIHTLTDGFLKINSVETIKETE